MLNDCGWLRWFVCGKKGGSFSHKGWLGFTLASPWGSVSPEDRHVTSVVLRGCRVWGGVGSVGWCINRGRMVRVSGRFLDCASLVAQNKTSALILIETATRRVVFYISPNGSACAIRPRLPRPGQDRDLFRPTPQTVTAHAHWGQACRGFRHRIRPS